MKKIGLALSGGKDSMACWFLCRDADPYVLWVNTGKAYPETLKVIDYVRAKTEKFVEIKTDQEAQIQRHGLPSDIVPIDATNFGMAISGQKPVKVQSYLQCCHENLSAPLQQAAKNMGITTLIRGQRLDEGHKSPARNGDVVDGITYVHPIEHWSKKEVMDYLTLHMDIPKHFALEHSSMDCYDCTAFLRQSIDRAEWTRVRWPELHKKYLERMTALQGAIAPYVEDMTRITHGGINA